MYVLFEKCYSQLPKLENHLPVSFLFLLLEKSLINKRYKSMQNNTPFNMYCWVSTYSA